MLIEGPPGVGKTSLVENLAKVTGRVLSRVNLSE
jgi:midasin